MALPDAGMTQRETVPVFLAMGYGTRRIISCDYGQTWKDDQADVPEGGDDGYLVRGLGAGAGRFVATVGGGGVRKIWSSDDGVKWDKTMFMGSGYSDVVYGNGRFVVGGGNDSMISLDGIKWEQTSTMGKGSPILRHMAFGSYDGGRFVAVGDDGRRVSSKDGVTWSSEEQEGPTLYGVDFGAGVFVAITQTSETRYSEDGGATWKAGNIVGASDVRGILYDGKRFIVTTASKTFTSNDGKGSNWQAHDASGGPASFAMSDDGQHYAGNFWEELYHSSDGIHFELVQSSGQALVRTKFQRVKPSGACPLK